MVIEKFTSQEFMISDKIIYPKKALEKFHVQNIPDFINDILLGNIYHNDGKIIIKEYFENFTDNYIRAFGILEDDKTVNRDILYDIIKKIDLNTKVNLDFFDEFVLYIKNYLEKYILLLKNGEETAKIISDNGKEINKNILLGNDEISKKSRLYLKNERAFFLSTFSLNKSNIIEIINNSKEKLKLFLDDLQVINDVLGNDNDIDYYKLGNFIFTLGNDGRYIDYLNIFLSAIFIEKIFESDNIQFKIPLFTILKLDKIKPIAYFKEELIKEHIGLNDINNKKIAKLIKSECFLKIVHSKSIKESNKTLIYNILLGKSHLFLENNNVDTLINYILSQDKDKLNIIHSFFKNHYQKTFNEKDLIFIFKNNLEDFKITKAENIPKIQELKNNGIEISKLAECSDTVFNTVYNLYENKEISVNQFIPLTNEETYLNKFQSFLKHRNKMLDYLTYISEEDEQYTFFEEQSKIEYQTFAEKTRDDEKILQEEILTIDNKKRKILEVLNSENIDELKEDYYFLLEKIEKIKSKTKDKKLQKKEKEQRNTFIKNFFNKNSIDDIKLIINILKKVEISSNNTFETLENNINLIIQFKTFAREKIDEIKPKFLKDISEFLNKENQEEFYQNELEKQKIDSDYINEILTIYSQDNELKNILHILEYIDEKDDFILLITEKKISNNKLKTIINLLSLFKFSNIDESIQVDIIEEVIDKENFNYEEYKDKINFIRHKISLFKIENGNTNIKNIIIDYLRGEKGDNDIINELNKFNKIEMETNNPFDEALKEIIENQDEKKAEKYSKKIDNFLAKFMNNFIASKISSTENKLSGIGSGSYTNAIKRILKTLRKENNETYIKHLERISILNFQTILDYFLFNKDRLINNILIKSNDINLYFKDGFEQFSENVIKNINGERDVDLEYLQKFFTKSFKKCENLLV